MGDRRTFLGTLNTLTLISAPSNEEFGLITCHRCRIMAKSSIRIGRSGGLNSAGINLLVCVTPVIALFVDVTCICLYSGLGKWY
jgi:hypothetical protein